MVMKIRQADVLPYVVPSVVRIATVRKQIPASARRATKEDHQDSA